MTGAAKTFMSDTTEYPPRYLEGIEHFNVCDFYESHEVWEALWADYQLGAEIDGREHHALAAAFDADRDRQNEIHATGLVLIRFSVGKVLSEPAEVLRVTEANLLARASQLRLTR